MIGAVTSENVSAGMCAQRKFSSACACAFAQADLSLRWAHMSGGKFSHNVAQMLSLLNYTNQLIFALTFDPAGAKI